MKFRSTIYVIVAMLLVSVVAGCADTGGADIDATVANGSVAMMAPERAKGDGLTLEHAEAEMGLAGTYRERGRAIRFEARTGGNNVNSFDEAAPDMPPTT